MIEVPVADIDFYERKIRRLEADLGALQDQLTNARLRLRTAEDFQIKYELLLQKSQQENDKLKNDERQLANKHHELLTLKLTENDKQWNQRLEKTEEELNNQHKEAMNKLKEEFDQYKLKHDKCGNKSEEWDLLNFKNRKLQRENQILEQKIQQLKRDHENNRSEEIANMRENLIQKGKQRQESQRKLYRDQIEELEVKTRNLQDELKDALVKADPKRQKEIQRLKEEIQERGHQANAELKKISEVINEKNKKIEELLSDRFRVEEDLMNEKKELRSYIKILEDKLFAKEKEHQNQLLNLKERMSKVRIQEINELKNQIKKSDEIIQGERKTWDAVLEDKDRQMERVKRKADEDAQRHKEDKQIKLTKIQQLKEKLKQYEGEKHAGETEQMIKSLRDLEGRQADFANYENGVTFLDRQLKKATVKIQQKNLQITRVVKELNELRSDAQRQIEQMKAKFKKQKKYYTEKVSRLEEQVRELNESVRVKDKEIKRRQKDTDSEAFKLRAQNKSLKDLIEEMQRDYNRLIENKKNLEKNIREEREKGLTSKTDLTMAKKQKWLELQRQKNQMEVIFKEREERFKTQFEIEREKLRHERDNLRHENQVQKALIEDLKRGQEEADKENKYAEYNKKVATLNLQIALAQNMYDSLKEAKLKGEGEFQRISEKMSQNEGEEEKEKKEKNESGIAGQMIMSFNPDF